MKQKTKNLSTQRFDALTVEGHSVNAGEIEADARHVRYMKRCIELAKTAQAQGNTPVGSVVVVDDKVLAEGMETWPGGKDLSGHAELLACQAATEKLGQSTLAGATLYSTAEPCFMCSYVIRQSGISLVVYGKETPVIGGVTSPLPVLTDERLNKWMPPPKIIPGILAEECGQLSANAASLLGTKPATG